MKEVLQRANHAERQQYAKIQQQKSALSQRMQEISKQQEALNEKDTSNVLPAKPSSNIRAPGSRQATKETDDYNVKRKRYREELEVYRAKNIAILTERTKLMQEFLALKAEFDGFEETEKWLLLSMAIRNQSSLLGFMQSREDKDEK